MRQLKVVIYRFFDNMLQYAKKTTLKQYHICDIVDVNHRDKWIVHLTTNLCWIFEDPGVWFFAN
jgi:hypothetical protein